MSELYKANKHTDINIYIILKVCVLAGEKQQTRVADV